MQKLSTLCLSMLALLLSVQFASAQILFEEDFSGSGIPAGWTTTDASNQGVLWTWCAGPSANCVNLYGADPFAGTSAANGFMVMNSDGSGAALPTNHISRLTSPPINAAAANEVYVAYDSYASVFGSASTGRLLLKVSSNNGNTWTSFEGISTLGSNEVSGNPEKVVIDISSAAANKPAVLLQWEWTGNWEYWWHIDDVKVTSQNPTPANNLAIGDFFYPVSSYATPVSQIASDTFSFQADVSNLGTADQTNVTLIARVLNVTTGAVLFADSTNIGTLAAGYLDSVVDIAGRFIPALPIGVYRVAYSVHSDQTEGDPGNNSQFDNFEVTDFIFSKENGPTNASQPATGGDYAIANYYRMDPNNLDQYKAIGTTFAAATNPGLPIGDISIVAYLFRLNDDVDDSFTTFDGADFISTSFNWIGLANYDMPDAAENYDLQDVELTDLSGNVGIPLDPGGRYFLAIQYSGASNAAFQAYNDRTSHYFVSSAVYSDQWYLAGFGEDFNPVIRMVIELVTTTDEKPLPATSLQVVPNPVRDGVLNLAVEFAEPTQASITLADMSGRVIDIDNRPSLTKEVLHYDIPELSNGTYLARIATKEGTRTVKFVVAH